MTGETLWPQAKITGGGALENFYKSEDPLLLHSIRRGDFVEKPGPLPKPYVDGQVPLRREKGEFCLLHPTRMQSIYRPDASSSWSYTPCSP